MEHCPSIHRRKKNIIKAVEVLLGAALFAIGGLPV